jgi:hypothetical protein
MQPGLACIRATSESSTFIVPCRANVVEPDIVDGHDVGMVQRARPVGLCCNLRRRSSLLASGSGRISNAT